VPDVGDQPPDVEGQAACLDVLGTGDELGTERVQLSLAA
jgi:hypothetical protein